VPFWSVSSAVVLAPRIAPSIAVYPHYCTADRVGAHVDAPSHRIDGHEYCSGGTGCGALDIRFGSKSSGRALAIVYCASVSQSVRCVSTNVRRTPASVSDNVLRKGPSIARLADHHCAPLHIAGPGRRGRRRRAGQGRHRTWIRPWGHESAPAAGIATRIIHLSAITAIIVPDCGSTLKPSEFLKPLGFNRRSWFELLAMHDGNVSCLANSHQTSGLTITRYVAPKRQAGRALREARPAQAPDRGKGGSSPGWK
jgi:hypothetical protein